MRSAYTKMLECPRGGKERWGISECPSVYNRLSRPRFQSIKEDNFFIAIVFIVKVVEEMETNG